MGSFLLDLNSSILSQGFGGVFSLSGGEALDIILKLLCSVTERVQTLTSGHLHADMIFNHLIMYCLST